MHCWLMVEALLNGTAFVLLRGVNWHGEFEASRPHIGMGWTMFWHVPTVKFSFDRDAEPPSQPETLAQAALLIAHEWPGLATNQMAAIDQDFSGRLGRFNASGEAEPVTRICIQLGQQPCLPDISLLPGRPLPWQRHPVRWVDTRAITRIMAADWPVPIHPDLCSIDEKTAYVVKDMTEALPNILLQASVAEAWNVK
jgi:hypothetical protein